MPLGSNTIGFGTGGGGGGGTTDTVARAQAAANTASINLNDTDIAALQTQFTSIDGDNATQTELDAVTAAQALLDTAQDGTITANAGDITALQTAVGLINADNLTQTESDAIEAAQTTLDAAQDALIAANTAALATKQDLLPTGNALEFLRRNAADDDWELAEVQISSVWELLVDTGTPEAGKAYYQTDAAHGHTQPTLTAGQAYSIAKPTALGNPGATTYYHDGNGIIEITGDPQSSAIPTYATVAALPDATLEALGSRGAVTQDPTSANNGLYIVANDGGGNFWVK